MKPANSGPRRVKSRKVAPCAPPLSPMHCPLSTALIIGYGNPLRSDDGIGWRSAELLAECLAGQDVEVIPCHQLTPELAEPLSRSMRAVFIDADTQGKPGRIRRRVVRAETAAASAFTHTCTPSGLLASARQLYGHSPQAIAITVTAQSFEYGGSLVRRVRRSPQGG